MKTAIVYENLRQNALNFPIESSFLKAAGIAASHALALTSAIYPLKRQLSYSLIKLFYTALGSVPKPDYMLYPLTVIEEREANDKKSNR